MSPKQYFIENAIKINRVCCGSARALREGLENEEEIEKSQYLSSPALGAFVLKNYHNRFMGNMFFIIFIWSDFQSNLKFVWCSEWKKATKQVAKLLIPPNKKKEGEKFVTKVCSSTEKPFSSSFKYLLTELLLWIDFQGLYIWRRVVEQVTFRPRTLQKLLLYYVIQHNINVSLFYALYVLNIKVYVASLYHFTNSIYWMNITMALKAPHKIYSTHYVPESAI